jgi:hypothetical protein
MPLLKLAIPFKSIILGMALPENARIRATKCTLTSMQWNFIRISHEARRGSAGKVRGEESCWNAEIPPGEPGAMIK